MILSDERQKLILIKNVTCTNNLFLKVITSCRVFFDGEDTSGGVQSSEIYK